MQQEITAHIVRGFLKEVWHIAAIYWVVPWIHESVIFTWGLILMKRSELVTQLLIGMVYPQLRAKVQLKCYL